VESKVAEPPTRNWVNLRVGAGTSSGKMVLCGEVEPLERLSLEACGTGSELLHQEHPREISHYRMKYRLASWKTEIGWLQPRVGLGFAELQVGEDDVGFDFGGVGPRGTSTSGPEASFGLRALYPLGAGIELVGELNLGAAWFRFAPDLTTPLSAFQPTAAVSFGVGW
jgi:hypothetical protein